MRGLALLLLVFSTPVFAQSSKVEVDVPPESASAVWLESEGFVLIPDPPGMAYVTVILPDSDLPRLRATGLPHRVVEHSRPLRDYLGNGRALDSRFFDWAEINQALADLETAWPNLARRVDLTAMTGAPMTHGGRSIYGLLISDFPAALGDEPNALFVGNHHAREIDTPAHMLDLASHLCSNYSTDPEIASWVDSTQIWIIPTMNPDGLEHVWNVDQWWRKNRRNNGGGVYGVDLNRNYVYDWANCGSFSHSPSSDVYVGPYPESEPETQTMTALARTLNFTKVIDVHQSGREVLYPYACGNMDTEMRNEVFRVRDALAASSGYSTRYASAGGEHFEWEFNEIGSLSYLLELNTTFFPSWSQSLQEILRARPAYLQMLREVVPIRGHVRDAATGVPLDAALSLAGVNHLENEIRQSRASNAGRYHLWVEDGSYNLSVTAPNYVSVSTEATASPTSLDLDVWLPSSNAPWLALEGNLAVGSSIRFVVDGAAVHAGQICTVALSQKSGGPFGGSFSLPGGLSVPLAWDKFTQWTQKNASLVSGTVSASGRGETPWLVIPPIAGGRSWWAAGILSDSNGVFTGVTPALPFLVP